MFVDEILVGFHPPMKKPAMDKHISLFGPLVRYREKSFITFVLDGRDEGEASFNGSTGDLVYKNFFSSSLMFGSE
jgi:hypothetical protein